MTNLIVKKERLGLIVNRHPWVFSGALVKIPEGINIGAIVRLVDQAGNFLARGYFNSYSQIAVRVLSYKDEEIDVAWFEKRIGAAYNLREAYLLDKKTNACRIMNSEGDLLPGLVVDKYDDVLAVQFHNRGISVFKDLVTAALVKIVRPKAIYERSDFASSKMIEGDRGVNNLLYGKMPNAIIIQENDLKFNIDVAGGQKTGFFLDQRDKRLALMKYVKDKDVLNCFSYTGGFGVYALAGDAKRVVNVDVSQKALDLAAENAALNKLPAKKFECIAMDAKDYLRGCKEVFPVIILDPPAYIKDRHKKDAGVRGYMSLNEQAIRLLPPNGILLTASCSAHLSLEEFREVVMKAAGRAGRTVQILEEYAHGVDHPRLISFREGDYLKTMITMIK